MSLVTQQKKVLDLLIKLVQKSKNLQSDDCLLLRFSSFNIPSTRNGRDRRLIVDRRGLILESWKYHNCDNPNNCALIDLRLHDDAPYLDKRSQCLKPSLEKVRKYNLTVDDLKEQLKKLNEKLNKHKRGF